MDLLIILLYILFVLAAIVLIVVVLLQEGRGGGFGEALGVHGRETFGVGSRGINTFTGVTAGVFLCSALVIHILNRVHSQQSPVFKDSAPIEAPVDGGGAPAGGGSGAPAGNGGGDLPPPPPAGN